MAHKIELLDRAGTKYAQEQIDLALAKVLAELGLKAKPGSAKYDGGGQFATLSLELSLDKVDEKSGLPVTKAAVDWQKQAVYFGLKAEWLGQKVPNGKGGNYTIVGLKTTRSKFPVLVTDDATGKSMLLTVDGVVGAMARKEGAARLAAAARSAV